MKSRLTTVLVSLGVIALGVAGFVVLKLTKPAPPEKKSARVRPIVRVMEARKQDFRSLIEESGTVEPKTVLDVTAEVSGRIVFVSENLRVGYFVSKGELLVEIDPREYRLNVAQAKAEIMQLGAEMDQTKQRGENLERNLGVEREKLKLSSAELERKETLLKSGSMSESAVDKQRLDTKQKLVALMNQQNAFALLESQAHLIEAKIEATKAKMELAELKLEKTRVLAPFDGRVQEESVEKNTYVQVGRKLATVYDISAMEIVINVSPERGRPLVSLDKSGEPFPEFKSLSEVNEWFKKNGPSGTVRFKVGDGGHTWKGKVTRLKSGLDETTRTVPVVVEVKDPFKGVKPGISPPLVPGMFVDVALEGKLFRDVVRLPRSALHEGSVYLVTDGRLEIRKVDVALKTRDQAIITAGVKSGDKVILSPMPIPIPGTELRIAGETKSPEQPTEQPEVPNKPNP